MIQQHIQHYPHLTQNLTKCALEIVTLSRLSGRLEDEVLYTHPFPFGLKH